MGEKISIGIRVGDHLGIMLRIRLPTLFEALGTFKPDTKPYLNPKGK